MFAALLSTLLVAAGPAESSLKSLEGDWTVERMEQKGKKFPTDLLIRVRLQVRGDIFTFVNGQTEFTSRVTKFDASGDPRAIDLTRDADKQTVRGIYKVDGDTLTICTNVRGDRPSSFAADAESPNVLTVYKRASAPAGR
jgi:uncharacterized protein (TIGR03067 family)